MNCLGSARACDSITVGCVVGFAVHPSQINDILALLTIVVRFAKSDNLLDGR